MYAARKFLDIDPWVGERRHESILLACAPDNGRPLRLLRLKNVRSAGRSLHAEG
jgi:hypothetical protein